MSSTLTAATDEDIRWNLALASRILARRSLADTSGQISQRSLSHADRFFISRRKGPSTVTPEDTLELDIDGKNIELTKPDSYMERFMHAEIYRARPEIMSIVYTHSPAVLLFSIVRDVTLQCVCGTAAFIGASTPVFEIGEPEGGATNLLIHDAARGAALAKCLGDRSLVLIRGRGLAAVGLTLAQAVYHAVYAEVNAQIQGEALRLGQVTYLSADEVAPSPQLEAAVERAWGLWVSEVAGDIFLPGAEALQAT